MRAVLVLLALGLVAWGVFQVLPTSQVEGKQSGEEAPPIQFLDRPGAEVVEGPEPTSAAEPTSDEPEPAAAPALPPSAEASAPPAAPVFGLRASDVPSTGSEDPELARALLFGRPGDVERAVARLGLPDGEGRFYRAFAEALAGNRKGGLELAQGLDDPQVLEAEDRALLQAALSGQGAGSARAASTRAESLARRALRLKLLERDAEASLAEERFAEAAGAYSDLLLAGLKGPWEAGCRPGPRASTAPRRATAGTRAGNGRESSSTCRRGTR
jgi:hypothetical protein